MRKNALIVILMVTVVCLGFYNFAYVIPQFNIIPSPLAQAQTYNYTNVYDNSTYANVLKSVEGKVKPNRELDIGISISNTCYQMHKYKLSSICPTYQEIMVLFPDTSNQFISGEFIMKDNQWQRDRPRMESHYDWYAFQTDKTHIFIDPDAALQSQLAMIHIESRLGQYPLSLTVENNTRYMGEGRYIDSCRHATIGSENWIFMVGDTIELLRNDCHPTFTMFNETKVIRKELVEHDIVTSAKWIHDKYLEWVKENCLYEYDKC